MRPRLTSGRANLARVEARMKSQHSATSNPPPKAYPFTAATLGCGRRSRASKTWRDVRWYSRNASAPTPEYSPTSAPAMKPRPVPVRTTARTSRSCRTRTICSPSAATSAPDSAPSFSSRSIRRTRTTPLPSTAWSWTARFRCGWSVSPATTAGCSCGALTGSHPPGRSAPRRRGIRRGRPSCARRSAVARGAAATASR